MIEARTVVPSSPEEAAEAMADAASEGGPIRLAGAGTKLDWGRFAGPPAVLVSTAQLDRIVEHNSGDMTAVLEAGVGLGEAREVFAGAGQMLALDPPLGSEGKATLGGIVATGDSGPLRQRYGAPRDLLLGVTVALADGVLAHSGGKVIKNVAGYDLAKLFAGSFGTLGLIVEVVVRLHPIPKDRVTVEGASGDERALQRAVLAVARLPLELESLDIAWDGAGGSVLARLAGSSARAQTRALIGALAEAGIDGNVEDEDEPTWARQRARQRSDDGVVVRVSALPTALERVLRAAGRRSAGVVGRAGAGLFWITLPPAGADDLVAGVERLRRELRPFPCVVLDAPAEMRQRTDVWDEHTARGVELMRRVKARFDPGGVCNPGVYVGGM